MVGGLFSLVQALWHCQSLALLVSIIRIGYTITVPLWSLTTQDSLKHSVRSPLKLRGPDIEPVYGYGASYYI